MPRKGQHQSDEAKAKISKYQKGKVLSVETKKKISESRKKMHYSFPSPNKGKVGPLSATYGRKHTEEEKRKISEKAKIISNLPENKNRVSKQSKLLWENNKEFRIKLTELARSRRGPLSKNWRGGKSFEPYCYKFNEEFKNYIRHKFDYTCVICGRTEQENYDIWNEKLGIHHIDYNKNSICNGKSWGFVPLCKSCHMKTNYNRWYWFSLLINYWVIEYCDYLSLYNMRINDDIN